MQKQNQLHCNLFLKTTLYCKINTCGWTDLEIKISFVFQLTESLLCVMSTIHSYSIAQYHFNNFFVQYMTPHVSVYIPFPLLFTTKSCYIVILLVTVLSGKVFCGQHLSCHLASISTDYIFTGIYWLSCGFSCFHWSRSTVSSAPYCTVCSCFFVQRVTV